MLMRHCLLGLFLLQISAAPHFTAADGGVAEPVGSETFSIVFLQQHEEFQLTPDFSSHAVAKGFCSRHGFPMEHVRAVRELIENAVADALGNDRIEAGMQSQVNLSHGHCLSAQHVHAQVQSFRPPRRAIAPSRELSF